MILIYGDPETSGFKGNPAQINANRAARNHFENSMFLSFMLLKGTFIEKGRAAKELDICERKIKYWKSRSDFVEDTFTEDCVKIKKKWL